jgi:hypothetical protein
MAQQGRMATMPAQGMATQTAPVVSPNAGYSGMATAIAKWGIGDEISQTTKLRWQLGVGGDRTKADQFCEVVGALQDFKTYLFIKPGSTFCTVIHSPLKFVAITEATQQLQGRIIGFVGDRTLTKEPTPVLLPQQKAWEWIKVKVATDGPAIIAHYEGNQLNRGTLWTPPVGTDETEMTVPRLLHIPLVVFDKIRRAGRPLMPHEVLSMIMEHVEPLTDTAAEEVGQAWQLAMQWCVVAAQHDTQGDSHIAFSVDAITKTDGRVLPMGRNTTWRDNGIMQKSYFRGRGILAHSFLGRKGWYYLSRFWIHLYAILVLPCLEQNINELIHLY